MAASHSASTDATLLQFTLRTVIVALRCWWRVITPVGVALAVVAGLTVLMLHKPKYTADAWLLIKDKPDMILRQVESGPPRFIQNQLEIIRSPRLLGPLTSNPEIISAPELVRERDLVRALAKRIKTSPRGDSDIYSVSFTSESPEKAELIVREVVSAYLAFNRKLDSEQQSQILRLLQDQREARYQEMNQLREQVRSLSMELTGVDPFRANVSPEEQSKASSSMMALQADLVRYEVAQDILAAHIKAEEQKEAISNSLPPEERARIDQEIEKHATYLAFNARLEQLQKKENDFQRTGKNLEKNSLYKQLQADLAREQAAQAAWAVQARQQLSDVALRDRKVGQSEKLQALKVELATGAMRLKLLNDKFQERMGTAQQFTGDNLGLEFHRAKLEQVTKIHDEISTRILALSTEQRAPDRVMPFKDATRPVLPDEAIPWRNIGLAAGTAFLLPFAGVVLWEHLFKRVSSRDQVEEAHQIAVVGEVTSFPVRVGRRASPRAALLFEESVDSLRTYLSLVDSLRDAQVLAITSAISGEGKTSLAAQLAISVERASGDRTLLIDGDMRSPSLHERFDLPVGPGLAEVLTKECLLNDAIQESSRENLFVLTAGRLSKNPHRLLKQGAFAELLAELRTQYRYIIVDTPPILPASEALIMARCADTSVLCMRRDFSRLDQVQEAHLRMQSAGVKTAGAVLNGIPLSHYARKYGAYPYGNLATSNS